MYKLDQMQLSENNYVEQYQNNYVECSSMIILQKVLTS